MKVIKQKTKLPIRDIKIHMKDCSGDKKEPIFQRNGHLLPDSIRGIFVGPSGAGKTTLLANLIYSPHGLRFKNIYIYTKSRYQDIYRELECVLKLLPEIGYFVFDNGEIIMEPNEAKSDSIFIFDDISCENQKPVRAYFSMGRHRNIDSFYLAQSYALIPKHNCRDTVNLLAIFRMDLKNLKYIYSEHVSPDISFNKFLEMCSFCWDDKDGERKYGCLVIDKTKPIKGGRYRRGFDEYLVPDD